MLRHDVDFVCCVDKSLLFEDKQPGALLCPGLHSGVASARPCLMAQTQVVLPACYQGL